MDAVRVNAVTVEESNEMNSMVSQDKGLSKED
jgi:hypothetical protein